MNAVSLHWSPQRPLLGAAGIFPSAARKSFRMSQNGAEMGFMKRAILLGFGIPGFTGKMCKGRKCRDISVLVWAFPGCMMHLMHDGYRPSCKANDVKQKR